MPKWMELSEEIPECEVGDRIVIIVVERKHMFAKRNARLVVLTATEDGWNSADDTYTGYSPEDAVLWAYESSVTEIARTLFPEFDWASPIDPERCPMCGCAEFADPLPGTVGKRCVKCCDVRAELALKQSYDDLSASGGIVDAP